MPPSHPKKKSPKTKPAVDYSTICKNASGIKVQQAFNKLGPINAFEDLLCPPGKLVGPTELAAEQVFHMIEGWRYASAATTAFLNNSQHTALHFAYYAELRAALSLLSWSGIRVKRNGIVPQSPTHTAVWGLWQSWVIRADAQALFNDNIRLTTGVSLAQVVTALQYIRPTQTLKGWGADLAKIKDDHSARNISSYEAFWMNTPLLKMKPEDLELILSLWKLLLPEETGLVFDSSLISYFVKQAVPGMLSQLNALKPATSSTSLAEAMDIIALEISDNTGLDQDHIARRLDTTQYNTTPFELASAKDTQPQNVMCRAFFLLRLSMLATKSSISLNANKPASDWLSNWFEHAGLWTPSSAIEPYDLSIDYSDAIDQFYVAPVAPSALWQPPILSNTIRLTRPDACMVWNVI
jgi:hypothetical protein